MVVFPNCKINLGLQVLEKRDDGYHNLQTVFYPLPFNDVLEIVKNSKDEIEFTATGIPVDGKAEDNLCIKAYQLLKKRYPQLPFVKIHLHKAIPLGAGLGGGSANAAFMLKLLNETFQLGISTEEFINYSLQLGSDCPFFILNKPAIATGRGEMLNEMPIDLSSFTVVLINPGIHINTGWAFNNLAPSNAALKNFNSILQQPIETWKQNLVNDFEEPVFAAYPQIKEIKEWLYLQGALYASMSGSGSTVYGIFNKKIDCSFMMQKNYFIKIIN